jgi:hypothetical protein
MKYTVTGWSTAAFVDVVVAVVAALVVVAGVVDPLVLVDAFGAVVSAPPTSVEVPVPQPVREPSSEHEIRMPTTRERVGNGVCIGEFTSSGVGRTSRPLEVGGANLAQNA